MYAYLLTGSSIVTVTFLSEVMSSECVLWTACLMELKNRCRLAGGRLKDSSENDGD